MLLSLHCNYNKSSTNDDREPKVRVESLINDLNYYLRNYSLLIKRGYRKSVLDYEIHLLLNEIRWLSEELKEI
jgi:hypothetical protein